MEDAQKRVKDGEVDEKLMEREMKTVLAASEYPLKFLFKHQQQFVYTS